MTIELHKNIELKLDFFLKNNNIPNILFHGPNGSGKRTLLNNFINKIYNNNKEFIKSYVMFVECAHGKGIKFVRDDIKFFAKTYMRSDMFKSIILLNADKLTIDAQSALRRCIEVFNHTTRFFIIVEDRYKLLKPILSRFCEMYIPLPFINNKQISLHNYNLGESSNNKISYTKNDKLKKLIDKSPLVDNKKITILANNLYEKGYSGLDIINYLEKAKMCNKKKYMLLILIDKIKREIRNEKLLIFIILIIIFRSNINLENIAFM